jgi:hypothetical protein
MTSKGNYTVEEGYMFLGDRVFLPIRVLSYKSHVGDLTSVPTGEWYLKIRIGITLCSKGNTA